ncbi:MAG TPA: hypothetical protein VJV75_00680 [Candidatus Polarisedimenticolia bacterium]|nr:hypothetical protein [Candidatus Polarisedimenticolia bacterium]
MPSVGEFVTMVANTGAAEPVSTDEALRGLERLGIVVADPAAPLTQGALARIMGSLGYEVTTRDPGAAVESTMTGAALRLVGSGAINPLRGISTEWFPPPQGPGGCLFGGVDCLQCCLRMHIPIQGCSRFCQNVVVSPSGPPT